MPYKRVLLKISGEALAGGDPANRALGIDQDMLSKVASDIKNVAEQGIQVCLVVGGGNIYRGVSGTKAHGIDRATSDYMGMLATVINALALQNAIEHQGVPSRVMTSIPMQAIGELYIRRRAIRHMEKGRVVIFAAGTGNPYFTTDTAAALRALEMDCDLLLKGTKVDGVYDADPMIHASATHYTTLTYQEVLERQLGVMDGTAIALVRENKLPIAVFSIFEENSFYKVIYNQTKFTLITD
jgi:uridylate kinase